MNTQPKSSPSFPQEMEIPVPLTVHESVSPKAAELLLKTADRLAYMPDEYCQGAFTTHHNCGTACCLLGHMARFAGLKLDYDEEGNINASRVGLTPPQYKRIFNTAFWPMMCRGQHDATPQEGIARIEHFLSTGI